MGVSLQEFLLLDWPQKQARMPIRSTTMTIPTRLESALDVGLKMTHAVPGTPTHMVLVM